MTSSIGQDEDLAVADAAGLGRLLDRLDHVRDLLVADDDLELHLGHEVDDVRRAAVDLVLPSCRPKPFTSVTVMPWMPIAERLSFTSSSLNGLMIASTFFMACLQFERRRGFPYAKVAAVVKIDRHVITPPRRIDAAVAARMPCAVRAFVAAADPEDVRALAVLREVEALELVLVVDAQRAEHELQRERG